MQTGSAITRSDVTWQCIQHCNESGKNYIDQTLNKQKTPYASPLGATFALSIVNILCLEDRFILRVI